MKKWNCLKKYILLSVVLVMSIGCKFESTAAETSVGSLPITHSHSGNSLTGGGCYTINNTTTQSITSVLGYQSATGGNQISLGSYDLTNVTNISATYTTNPGTYYGSQAYTSNAMTSYLCLGGSGLGNANRTQSFGTANILYDGSGGSYILPGSDQIISTSLSWDVSNLTGVMPLYTAVQGVGINYNFAHNITLTSLTLTNTHYDLGCGHTEGQLIGTLNINKKIENGKYELIPVMSDVDAIFTPVSYVWNTGDNGTCNVTGNNTYTLVLTYLDFGTQKTATFSYTVTDFDVDPPLISSSYDNSIWVKNSILEIQASDLGVGLAPEAFSFDGGLTWISENTLTIAGNATYTVLVRDNLGNIGTYLIDITNIDGISPTASVLYENSSYVKTGVMTIVAQDMESGLPAEPYSFDGGTTWTSQTTYTIIKNGIYEVLVRDYAGNISTISQFVTNIDTIAPTVTIPYDNNTYVKEGILTIQANDLESGLSAEPYSFDGGITWTTQSTYSISTNGSYEIIVQDQAGNTTSTLLTITNIDSVSPGATILYDNMTFVKTGLIEIQASDLESGLPAEPYSFDGGVTWTSESSYPILNNGTYLIFVRDILGNISTLTVVVSNIDSISPIVAVLYDNQIYVKSGIMEIQASDLESGLPAEPYSFDGGVTWVSNPFYTITSNGLYNLWVRDLIGNITVYPITVTNIDTSVPNIELEQEYQEEVVVITIQANDLEAGLSEKPYSYDQGATWTEEPEITVTESGNYDIWVKDAVGNIGKESVAVEVPEVVEELVIINESNVPFQQFFGTTMSTSGTGFFFMVFLYFFSSAAIYKKDASGKYIKIGKVRIHKQYGYYQIKISRRLLKKIKESGNQEILLFYSPIFEKNNLHREMEILVGKKKYHTIVTHKSILHL